MKQKEVALNAEGVNESVRDQFVFDSGATIHTCNNEKMFTDWNETSTNIKVMVANNKKVEVIRTGTVQLKLGDRMVSLLNVAYSPEFAANLISLSKFADKEEQVILTKNEISIKSHNGTMQCIGIRISNGLWIANNKSAYAFNSIKQLQQKLNVTQPELWHYRLGHVPIRELQGLSEAVNGLEKCKLKNINDQELMCDGCESGKAHRQPFTGSISKAVNKMDVWHTDSSGPMPESIDGYKYVSLATDAAINYVLCDLLAAKSEAGSRLINRMNQAENQQRMKLKELHHDGALEYKTDELKQYLSSKGIKQTVTIPHTPQHNSIAERMNRTIFESARSMLHQSGLPTQFWSFAIKYSVYIRNRLLSSKNKNKTPVELWTGIKPTLHFIRVFGCDAYIHVRDDLRKKMDSKATKGIFLGCDENRRTSILYEIDSGKIILSRDVKCFETSFTFAKQINQLYKSGEVGATSINYDFLDYNNQEKDAVVVQEQKSVEMKEAVASPSVSSNNYYQPLSRDDESKSDPDYVEEKKSQSSSAAAAPIEARRSERTNKGVRGTRYVEEVELNQHNNGTRIEELYYAFTTSATVTDVPLVVDTNPKSYNEAMRSPEADHWKLGVGKEVNSLIKHDVFEECELPPGKKAIGCRWLFTKKYNKDGEVERYKGRLIAKGFTQQEGVDYTDTFAPVMKYKTLRIILTLVQQFNLEIKQFDVETAFLNAELKEEVYMEIPDGLNIKRTGNNVLRLKKALYGTKQAPREWYEKITSSIVNLGFKRLVKENCVYIKRSRTGRVMIITIFVDDGTGSYHKEDEQEWLEIKEALEKEYTIKDLGDAEWILGMRIIRDREANTIKLNQSVYVEKVLKKFKMLDCNPVSTPLDPSVKLSSADSPITEEEKSEMKQFPYREVVGSLQYLCYSTRPDINYAVNLLSRFSINPGQKHWTAAKHVLRYLKGTKDYGLEFSNKNNSINNSLEITAYSDADWGGDLDGRKSTTGYFILLNDNVVSWASKKQTTVALSSAEAEYMALTGAGQEIKWMIDFLTELELYKQAKPVTLFTDSESADAMANNDVNHGRTKHIDIKHHWIRDAVLKEKIIELKYVNTTDQIADIHTKALTRVIFQKLRGRVVTVNK